MNNCIDTLLFGQVCDSCDGGALFKMVSFGVQILTYGIIVLATIGLIVAGVMFLTARENAAQTAKAKNRIIQVLIGIAVYALMFTIAEFIIPGNIMGTTLDSSTTSCPETPKLASTGDDGEEQGGGEHGQEASNTMGDLIARAAAIYSWPIQSWQKPFDSHYVTTSQGDGKSYGDAENGKCYYRSWETYGGPQSDCVKNIARITYREAGTSVGIGPGAYCDRFVSITLYSLGLNDGSSSGDFPHTGPTAQNKWLSNSSNWKEIENRGKDMLNGTAGVEQLQPGDVFALEYDGEKSGHMAIYVGKYGGSYGTLAEASASGKFPRITNYLDSAYHKVINGQSTFALSDTRKYHIYRYTGPMTEKAKSSPFMEKEEEDEPQDSGKTFERQANVYINRQGLPYILHVPEGAKSGMPLVIYMHGVGEVRAQNRLANLAPVKAFENSADSNKFIAIAPVQPDDSFSNRAVYDRTEALINEIVSTYEINTKRIYIYGFSMGGAHTWCLVDRNPNFFAAAAPMSMGTANSCVGTGPSAIHFKDTPIWAQCGGAETKKITEMQNFVNAINANGGTAKFNSLKNYDHGQTQNNADYSEIIHWLLEHKK